MLALAGCELVVLMRDRGLRSLYASDLAMLQVTPAASGRAECVLDEKRRLGVCACRELCFADMLASVGCELVMVVPSRGLRSLCAAALAMLQVMPGRALRAYDTAGTLVVG